MSDTPPIVEKVFRPGDEDHARGNEIARRMWNAAGAPGDVIEPLVFVGAITCLFLNFLENQQMPAHLKPKAVDLLAASMKASLVATAEHHAGSATRQ